MSVSNKKPKKIRIRVIYTSQSVQYFNIHWIFIGILDSFFNISLEKCFFFCFLVQIWNINGIYFKNHLTVYDSCVPYKQHVQATITKMNFKKVVPVKHLSKQFLLTWYLGWLLSKISKFSELSSKNSIKLLMGFLKKPRIVLIGFIKI